MSSRSKRCWSESECKKAVDKRRKPSTNHNKIATNHKRADPKRSALLPIKMPCQASALLIVPSVQMAVYSPVDLSQYAYFSIACHCAFVPWKLIVVKPLHPENAQPPMLVTLSGIVTLVRFDRRTSDGQRLRSVFPFPDLRSPLRRFYCSGFCIKNRPSLSPGGNARSRAQLICYRTRPTHRPCRSLYIRRYRNSNRVLCLYPSTVALFL